MFVFHESLLNGQGTVKVKVTRCQGHMKVKLLNLSFCPFIIMYVTVPFRRNGFLVFFHQGSHFSGLTKFPDFSSIFCHFSSIFLMFCFFLTENLIHFTKKCTVHLNITKNIISYTEAFAPIPGDIHRVLNECIH